MKEPDLEDCGQLLQRYYELKTSVPTANCIEKLRELLADSYALQIDTLTRLKSVQGEECLVC